MAKQLRIPIAFKRNIQDAPPATILAGDTGGTKTNMALYKMNAGELKMEKEKRYVSHEYTSLKDIVLDFCGQNMPDRLCAAVAGPVLDGKSSLTNLNWQLDSFELSKDLKIPVCFINDLEATAYGLAGLEEDQRMILAPGEAGARRMPYAERLTPTPGAKSIIAMQRARDGCCTLPILRGARANVCEPLSSRRKVDIMCLPRASCRASD